MDVHTKPKLRIEKNTKSMRLVQYIGLGNLQQRLSLFQ